MTSRAYGLLAFAVVLFFGLLDMRSAHAQTATPICALDISDALAVLLTMPAESVLASAFLAGFTVPMTAYLVAYLVGILVSMFDNH